MRLPFEIIIKRRIKVFSSFVRFVLKKNYTHSTMCRKLMLYSHKILPMEKSNFFIVSHFFGEITVQCNPMELKLFSFAWCFVNIVLISIIVSGRMHILNGNKHRYQCRGRRPNHTNQPIHAAQLLYMCVCLCIIVTNSKVEFRSDCDTYEILFCLLCAVNSFGCVNVYLTPYITHSHIHAYCLYQ